MDNISFDKLPSTWQRKIQDLRTECADGRITLRKTRAELAAVRDELDTLKAETGR